MRNILYILVFLCSSSVIGQADFFKKGNDFYNAGNYETAITTYMHILKSNKHSAELYFNLANAHYKLNHIAPSVFYYEKALQLNPKDQDIKNNLLFSKNMTIDAVGVLPETGFSRMTKKVIHALSFDGWATFAVVCSIVFVVLFLIYYFVEGSLLKRVLFIGSSVSFLLMFITLIFAFNKYSIDKNNKPAIVFAKEAEIKNEPNKRGNVVFKLHEGVKVQVLDSIKNWHKIKLTDGKQGWISTKAIKRL